MYHPVIAANISNLRHAYRLSLSACSLVEALQSEERFTSDLRLPWCHRERVVWRSEARWLLLLLFRPSFVIFLCNYHNLPPTRGFRSCVDARRRSHELYLFKKGRTNEAGDEPTTTGHLLSESRIRWSSYSKLRTDSTIVVKKIDPSNDDRSIRTTPDDRH